MVDLISQAEAMERVQIKSRSGLYNLMKNYGLPKPVKTHPMAFVASDIDQWILNGGINSEINTKKDS